MGPIINNQQHVRKITNWHTWGPLITWW